MVSKDDVKALANLSKLYLNEEEIEKCQEEIDSMIKFVSQMNSVEKNLDNIKVSEDITNALRNDEVKKSYPQEEILSGVGGGKDGFFYLPKSK